MFHAKTANTECLREAYEVGIVEPGTRHPPELGHLLPSDAPETTVAEDQVHRGGPLPLCCLQFMDAHQESAVTAQGHDPASRIGELRGDSPREGDAHRREAVRDDDGIRLHRPGEPAEPEFMSSHIP